MKKAAIIIVLTLLSAAVFAQNRYTISGYFKDAFSGETLIGATLTVKGISRGISSNHYGFYSITLTEGNYTLIASFVGYQSQVFNISLVADSLLNISLVSGASLSEEVIITARKRDNNLKSA